MGMKAISSGGYSTDSRYEDFSQGFLWIRVFISPENTYNQNCRSQGTYMFSSVRNYQTFVQSGRLSTMSTKDFRALAGFMSSLTFVVSLRKCGLPKDASC